MDKLPIVWQRLVDERGATCPRCQGTGREVERAVEQLKRLLRPLGLEPVLEVRDIDEKAFLQRPLDSNQVLIAGTPVEEWLGATVGSSPCCEQCGEKECRTLDVSGKCYEVLPEEMLVRAGILAGVRITQEPRSRSPSRPRP